MFSTDSRSLRVFFLSETNLAPFAARDALNKQQTLRTAPRWADGKCQAMLNEERARECQNEKHNGCMETFMRINIFLG